MCDCVVCGIESYKWNWQLRLILVCQPRGLLFMNKFKLTADISTNTNAITTKLSSAHKQQLIMPLNVIKNAC